jgi:hypothetical protein
LLSKLLTFGAPGRFPRVKALPGDMPMAEFELEAAKTMLEEAAADGDITSEQGAEIFANVVNCMLIDIVDLASSALKEDDKILVDAINVVVDYMNHAASLYDSVAEVSSLQSVESNASYEGYCLITLFVTCDVVVGCRDHTSYIWWRSRERKAGANV